MSVHKKRTISKSKYIQLIHIAKSQLAFDDGTYRHMLKEVTGKTSTKHMNLNQLGDVLAHMKALGFKVTPAKKSGKLKQADDPQSKKIRSLWIQLHEAGAVRDPSERALAKFVERQTKVSALQFLSTHQASEVIESLKQWQARLSSDPATDNPV